MFKSDSLNNVFNDYSKLKLAILANGETVFDDFNSYFSFPESVNFMTVSHPVF